MNTNLRITNWLFIRYSSFVVRPLFWLLPAAYCLLPAFTSKAQEKSTVITYAREIIDTLCSPSMHGRGYVNKGDSIAADYIRKEFEKLGVKPIGKEFEQRFELSVNTFPETPYLKINKRLLIPGKDFLPAPHCPSCNDKLANVQESRSVIKESKLTHAVSKEEGLFCAFIIHESILPRKIRHATFRVVNKFIPHYRSQNVLGYIKGTQYPDSFIVFSAHYDHLGRMGKDVYFPGANDNASGCAMLLNLAKYYSENPPKYSIAFMAFGAEEAGLIGSKYYVEHPLFPLKQIKFLINMDIMGTGDEGITVVNGTEHKQEFEQLLKINEEKKLLPQIKIRGKAANSDHYFFSEAGVKSFFIYTMGGIKAYHDIYDRPETLPLTKFEELYNLLLRFTDYLQN